MAVEKTRRYLAGTPEADGFSMPAESAPHAGCWLIWPERRDNWRERAVPVQLAFVQLVAAIARFEPVTVGASPRRLQQAREALTGYAEVVPLPNDDCWIRDTGPSFVVDAGGGRRAVAWRFNAWGGVYDRHARDDRVAMRVAATTRAACYRAPLVMEGGSFHVDGQGTALVTEQCLLNRNRNPTLDRHDIAVHLHRYLGVSTVIWLGRGVVNDETSGHIDNLACFVRPGEVLLNWTNDRSDPQYRVSADALERLRAARDAQGRRLQIHKIPMPGPLYMSRAEAAGVVRRPGIRMFKAGRRLAGSYVNFYLANGAVIAPLLDTRTDDAALRVLRRVYPDRVIVGVSSREFLLGGGNIHCLTQQVPALAGRATRTRGGARADKR
jgi:agmatine deiminase